MINVFPFLSFNELSSCFVHLKDRIEHMTQYRMKEMLCEMRCLKSNEVMILALAGQSKQLSHEPEKL